MQIQYPQLLRAEKILPNAKRLLIAAFGFEDRSLGWTDYQYLQGNVISDAILIRYKRPKGENKIVELKKSIKKIGVSKPIEIKYDVNGNTNIENEIEKILEEKIVNYDEIVLDITALTKFLILIILCKLDKFKGGLRIIYSEAVDYAPEKQEYLNAKDKLQKIIRYPSRGFGTILRAKCLSSIRMQGQNVTLVAFTSFNEQLVRHMLGTISPHHLVFINGQPPREDYKWRERATTEIHQKLINEFADDNKTDAQTKLLGRTTSTFYYEETIECIDKVYENFGKIERIIVAATGSKMQTVGLFFSKIKHDDIHIEYPTPDSYYIKGFTTGIKDIHEIKILDFNSLLLQIRDRL